MISEACTALTMVVEGEVYGVGFRRFVWGLGKRLWLVGFVTNTSEDKVLIYVEGERENVERFKEKILRSSKAFSINRVEVREGKCRGKFKDFVRTECIADRTVRQTISAT